MTDLEPILELWRELDAAGADYLLATVVAVEGSSYRRPGAHMLLAQDGRRVGTVSAGCLEADVARRAWWLTSEGPIIQQFSTLEEDGDRPYGSGCGGRVSILLERRATAAPLLSALHQAFHSRTPLAIATVLDGPEIARRGFSSALDATGTESELSPRQAGAEFSGPLSLQQTLDFLAVRSLSSRASSENKIPIDGSPVKVWTSYRAARPGLWIFGAGDDARPLARQARELGWFAAVADGRSHLATRDRFPFTTVTAVLDVSAMPGPAFSHLDLRSSDAAVVMTHSFDQDSRVLAALLSRDEPLAYIGVLGPQRRTRELLVEAARLLGYSEAQPAVHRWLEMIHAPTGLDLGAETPAAIALSVLAEVQQTLFHGTALPLQVVRGARLEASRS